MLLVVTAATCARIDVLDGAFRKYNAICHKLLTQIVSTDKFSLVNIDMTTPCRFNVKRCDSQHCRVLRKQNKKHLRSVVDLRSIPEAYSPHHSNSVAIWRMLYDLTSRNALLTKMLSGLHFSITVHISAFFSPFLGTFIPNSSHYCRRYKSEYKENLYALYVYVASAIHILAAKGVPDVLALKTCVVPFSVAFKVSDTRIAVLREMLDVINCLDCDRCRLWAKVQVQGLIVATNVHMGRDVQPGMDIVCLMRLFHALSTSIAQIRRLESFAYRYVSMLMIHKTEMLYLLLGAALFWCFIPKR